MNNSMLKLWAVCCFILFFAVKDPNILSECSIIDGNPRLELLYDFRDNNDVIYPSGAFTETSNGNLIGFTSADADLQFYCTIYSYNIFTKTIAILHKFDDLSESMAIEKLIVSRNENYMYGI